MGFKEKNRLFDAKIRNMKTNFTEKDLAAIMNGRQKYFEINQKIEKKAKTHGLVVCFTRGWHIVFHGAFYADCSVFNKQRNTFCFSKKGEVTRISNLPDFQNKIDLISQENPEYYCFETDIPHETFDLLTLSKNNVICKGIVFNVKNLK